MTEDKATKTTLESVFVNSHELQAFANAKALWVQLALDNNKKLEVMADIGHGLNLLYSKGTSRGLKKNELTNLVELHFPGLSRSERSEYRKLDRNFDQVNCFVKEYQIKSGNPVYLVNKWLKAVKEDCEECAIIEETRKNRVANLAAVEKAMGKIVGGELEAPIDLDDLDDDDLDLDDDDDLDDNTLTLDKKTVKQELKKGFENIVKKDELKPSEVVEQLGFICNQVKTMFNTDKFSVEQIAIITKHLTTTIAHVNGVDENIKMAV